uniref:hypothetical protein n=1 Tax=Cupriavidus taiwanensis TaxID=164546 RepID=UPI0011C05028|nr:hypothetical protein [Cupriavidus taiwanensis]
MGTEKADAVTYYGARVPWEATYSSFTFKHYKGRDVKAALRKLAGGNCAYCESKIGGVGAREVEHYRPKGGIKGLTNHPGYWWLAHDWENLLPTCRDCNKSLRQHIVTPVMTKSQVEELLSKTPKDSYGKATQFDIRGNRAIGDSCSLMAEDPLLIDPCRRDPANELSWTFSSELILMVPKQGGNGPSPYGDYTIRTCALNRAELVLDRISALRSMRMLRTHIMNRLEDWSGSQKELIDIMEEVKVLVSHAEPDQAYSGMAAAFVKDFEEELDRWRVARGLPPF